MAAFTSILAWGALAATGVSAYQQYESGQDASEAAERQAVAAQRMSKAQEERAALEARRADIQNARTVRSAIRQQRLVRAAVINTGANAGTSGSSGVIGGVGSLGSQLASNLGFFGQMGDINSQVLTTQRTEAGARTEAGYAQGEMYEAEASGRQWGAIGNLGGTIFSGAGGFRTIFKD